MHTGRPVGWVERLRTPSRAVPLAPAQDGFRCAQPILQFLGALIASHRGGLKDQIAPAAMFTVRASNVALKMNDTTPWAATRRRNMLDVTATSETCDVMPTTKEK